MKCTHPMDEESIVICMVNFGPCWDNPPKTNKKPKSYSNKPSGSYPKDKRFD